MAQQYRITIIPIEKNVDKAIQTSIIKQDYSDKVEEVNLAVKGSKVKANDFLCSSIFNIGLLKDKTSRVLTENIKEANFLFLDFEELNNSTDRKVLSFSECEAILKENDLNYVLKTSYNHTSDKPRLHLFLPTLKPIKSDEEYKYNLQLVKDKYFHNFQIDESAKNIGRWVFSSKSETLEFSSCFEKNDIEPPELDKHLIDVKKQITKRGITFKPSDKHMHHFVNQVENLYGFKYAKYDSNGVIKFYRDEKDNTPNVWYSLSFYDSETNKYTIYDHEEMYNVLFSYEDFQNSINPEKERDVIQSKMALELENWFIDGGKKYVVTNEGLGKSSTVLKMGQSYKFIFACHTKKRVKEISDSMTEEGIQHSVILSNSEILKNLASVDIATDYDEKISENNKLGFKDYVNKNIKDKELKELILSKYEENSQNLKDTNTVRIVTSKKLQLEIEKVYWRKENIWFQDDNIIFDEFILDEWSLCRAPEEGEEVESKPTIWNKEDSYISLAENPSSFQDLLKPCKSVLILTTERSLIELIFHESDYREMMIFELIKGNITSEKKYTPFSFYKLEQKLFDENVIYILTSSTKQGEVRDDLINNIRTNLEEEYNEDFIVISNNSEHSDVAHAGVKGSNEYADKNTIIIGTLRTEIEDNILYYSAEDYFNEFKEYIKEQHPNLTEDEQATKAKTAIHNYIKQVNLSTQVSQSIGRNSGFRDRGKKTVVVLPILQPNSRSKFNPRALNYISPNVLILNKEDKTTSPNEPSLDEPTTPNEANEDNEQ